MSTTSVIPPKLFQKVYIKHEQSPPEFGYKTRIAKQMAIFDVAGSSQLFVEKENGHWVTAINVYGAADRINMLVERVRGSYGVLVQTIDDVSIVPRGIKILATDPEHHRKERITEGMSGFTEYESSGDVDKDVLDENKGLPMGDAGSWTSSLIHHMKRIYTILTPDHPTITVTLRGRNPIVIPLPKFGGEGNEPVDWSFLKRMFKLEDQEYELIVTYNEGIHEGAQLLDPTVLQSGDSVFVDFEVSVVQAQEKAKTAEL